MVSRLSIKFLLVRTRIVFLDEELASTKNIGGLDGRGFGDRVGGGSDGFDEGGVRMGVSEFINILPSQHHLLPIDLLIENEPTVLRRDLVGKSGGGEQIRVGGYWLVILGRYGNVGVNGGLGLSNDG